MTRLLNQLEKSLAEGKFCFTAELVPALTTNLDSILEEVSPLVRLVEAINITDGAAAKTTMSSFAAATILASNNIEPVLQLTCRDRNRIALCADLIGAAAFGISNLLPLTGDDPANGDQPDAKAVHDINSAELISLASDMSEKGILPNGREIDSPPHFHIGCADVPQRLKEEDNHPALVKKIDSGASFVQTQLCYDIDLMKAYISDLGERGILDKALLIVDRAIEPRQGQVVIAAINGELTCKILDIQNKQLLAANPAYAPIIINEDSELVIEGVVIHAINTLCTP